MNALREFVCTLADALASGDWGGHLRAWWRVARGQVDGETRVVLLTGSDAATGTPAAARTVHLAGPALRRSSGPV